MGIGCAKGYVMAKFDTTSLAESLESEDEEDSRLESKREHATASNDSNDMSWSKMWISLM